MNTFDTYAAQWDSPARVERAQEIAQAMLNGGAPLVPRSALEFGCGTGLITRQVYRAQTRYTLLDPSEGMCAVAKQYVQTQRWPNVHVIQGGLNAPELRGQQFGWIYTAMVLHHIPDLVPIFSGFYEKLLPGGVLSIVDLMPDTGLFHADEADFAGHHGFDLEGLVAQLEGVGFRMPAHQVFYHGTKSTSQGEIPYDLFVLRVEKPHDPLSS